MKLVNKTKIFLLVIIVGLVFREYFFPYKPLENELGIVVMQNVSPNGIIKEELFADDGLMLDCCFSPYTYNGSTYRYKTAKNIFFYKDTAMVETVFYNSQNYKDITFYIKIYVKEYREPLPGYSREIKYYGFEYIPEKNIEYSNYDWINVRELYPPNNRTIYWIIFVSFLLISLVISHGVLVFLSYLYKEMTNQLE
jgi:hypothetical protein